MRRTARTSPGLRRLAALALCHCLIAPAEVEAQRLNPTGRTVDLQVPLVERGRLIGQTLLRITADDELSVDTAGITALLAGRLTAEVVEALRAQDPGTGRLRPEDFTAVGLRFDYDPSLVQLAVEVPIEARPTGALSLRSERPTAEDLAAPARVSGRVNLLGLLDRDDRSGGGGDWRGPNLEADAALRLGGAVLEAEGRYRGDGRSGDRFTRRSARMVVDRSRVDVFVNGQLARTLDLDRGTYDLHDIPLVDGANEVVLVVETEVGREEILRFSQFFAPDLLAPGVVEFEIGAGAFADFDGGRIRYDEDRAVATGSVAFGLVDEVSLQMQAQATDGFATAGAGIATATPVGTFSLSGAYSSSRAVGEGAAARLTFLSSRIVDGPRLSVFGDCHSRRFSRLRDTARDERINLEVGARLSQPLTPTLDLTLAAGYGRANPGFRNRRSASVGLGGRPTTEFFWNRVAEYVDDPNRATGEGGFRVLARVGYRFDEHLSTSASYSTSRHALRGSASYRSGSGVGAFLNDLGEPIALVTGRATNPDIPESSPLAIISNRQGRFAILGATPGRYLVELNTEPPSRLEIEVPAGSIGLVRQGELQVGGPSR